MNRHKLLSTAIATLFTLGAFSFLSCNRQKADNEDTSYAADHATLEKTYADVQSIADEASDNGGSLANFRVTGGQTILSQCATVSIDTMASPRKIIIDFGGANCLCKDGVYRRGQIIVTFTGRYRDMGHTHNITFSNYYVNDNNVTGSKKITCSSNDTAGHPKYDVTVNGQIILANGAGTISWASQRTRTWLAGYGTKMWSDDVYQIEGSGTVTRANGKTFAIQITTPLHVATACRWIKSGLVQITPQGAASRTLDYGAGDCDALATYTANGKTYNITLRN